MILSYKGLNWPEPTLLLCHAELQSGLYTHAELQSGLNTFYFDTQSQFFHKQ